MNDDVVTVLISALVATLNPSLLAAVTVMLLLPHPKRLMLGYLLGAYTTSIVAGLVIVFALHGTSAVRSSSHVLTPTGDLVLGVVALAAGLGLATGREARLPSKRKRRKTGGATQREAKNPWQTGMLEKGTAVLSFAVGAAMSFPGLSYVNALGHIAHLNPPLVVIVLLVAYFCVMQQILLEGALLASVVAAGWTQETVVRAKDWFAQHGRQVAMVGLCGVGALLATRGVLTIG